MSNVIPRRIYDFLKDFPPFNLLRKDQILQLAEKAVVQYWRPDEIVFQQGEQPKGYLFVVKEGAIKLLREEEEGNILVDICGEGDIFGLRPLLAKRNYALTAKAEEETLIYAIDTFGLEGMLKDNPGASFYLAQSFASGRRDPILPDYQVRIFLERDRLIDSHFQLVEIQSFERSKDPVMCTLETRIREAATIMSHNEVGSVIVVNETFFPKGIITDIDFRKKVATGLVPLDAKVSAIMSSPVITIAPDITVADVQIKMVKNRINHLVLTEDGTRDSKVVGVISEHDLMVMQGNNPAILIREIKRSQTTTELRDIRVRAEEILRRYIYQEVSIAFISTMMTEVNDALIQRVIRMSEKEMEQEGLRPPKADFCWLTLGSEGRGEQLLRTDQDNALIFDEVPEHEYDQTKAYYLKLAQKITTKLNECGFAFCPGEMMASNPKWCQSVGEWKSQFTEWILEPEPQAVLYSSIFFDFRPVFGKRSLAQELTEHIFSIISSQTIFLSFLAKAALEKPPPLTFFRNFMVEKSGDHKDEFDIKARAMMPLTDAARVLILNAKVGKINNTFRRFEKLAELEPQNKELYEQAADAYEILMRYRALQGLKHKDSGRYFKPSELTKMEQINLRNSFQPIRELQALLNLRFQLAFLR